MNQISMMKEIDDLKAEVKARGEILDAIASNIGTENCWMKAADLDWRGRLRDFAEDQEMHRISWKEWKRNRYHYVTLYLIADYASAYFDDASVLWEQAEDSLPMFHVMAQGCGPHRTCIHGIHLAAWIRHLAEKAIPVQVIDGQFVEGDT